MHARRWAVISKYPEWSECEIMTRKRCVRQSTNTGLLFIYILLLVKAVLVRFKKKVKNSRACIVVINCARARSFRGYNYGVFSFDKKNKDEMTGDDRHSLHAITVVGYDRVDGKKVWIVRNSWNYWWGQSVRIVRPFFIAFVFL